MKNRSRLDITAEILNAASAGELKTKIMYSASLSFDQLKEYLTVLVDSGLLEYDAKKKAYKTTDKGRDLLAKYGKVKI
jgi:predicted transcriptional regulator